LIVCQDADECLQSLYVNKSSFVTNLARYISSKFKGRGTKCPDSRR
jgi:hypothetical protein